MSRSIVQTLTALAGLFKRSPFSSVNDLGCEQGDIGLCGGTAGGMAPVL